MTARRFEGRLTSLNPATANASRLPTWSSPYATSTPGSVTIAYPSIALAP